MDIIDLEAKVIGFIALKVENVDVSIITTASRFEELGFDLLETVQLLFGVEDTFGVSFDGEEVKGLRRVEDILTILVGIRRWVRC